jgi:hypothetical protein
MSLGSNHRSSPRSRASTVTRPEGKPDSEYARRKAELDPEDQLRLSLIEEQIVTDPDRTDKRRLGDDGVIYDFTLYDDYGFTVAYVRRDVEFWFVGFSTERGK